MQARSVRDETRAINPREEGLMSVGQTGNTVTEDQPAPSAVGQEPRADAPFTPEEAEFHYQRLGRWKGPDASPEAQAESHRFWQDTGLPGIHWLIARLRDELHDDRLHGAGSMLADLNPASLGPIV